MKPLKCKDIRRTLRLVWPILAFQDYRTALQDTYRMPLPCWYVQGYHWSIGRKLDTLCALTLQLIIKLFYQPTSETHHCFRSLLVPMYRQRTSWLNRIQHSLRLVLRRIPKIHVHPESWTRFGLLGQFIQYCLCYLHGSFVFICEHSCSNLPDTLRVNGSIYA